MTSEERTEWECDEEALRRDAQTGHAPAPESTDPARVARYVEAIERGHTADAHLAADWEAEALAVVAVADEEHAPLVSEVRRLEGTLDRASRDTIAEAEAYRALFAKLQAAEKLADQIGERVAYYRDSEIPALRSNADGWAARAQVAEAKVVAVEALADEQWLDPANFTEPLASVLRTLQRRLSAILCPQPEWTPERIALLRASVGASVSEQRVTDNTPCPNCGGDRLRPNFTGDGGLCHVGGTPCGEAQP